MKTPNEKALIAAAAELNEVLGCDPAINPKKGNVTAQFKEAIELIDEEEDEFSPATQKVIDYYKALEETNESEDEDEKPVKAAKGKKAAKKVEPEPEGEDEDDDEDEDDGEEEDEKSAKKSSKKAPVKKASKKVELEEEEDEEEEDEEEEEEEDEKPAKKSKATDKKSKKSTKADTAPDLEELYARLKKTKKMDELLVLAEENSEVFEEILENPGKNPIMLKKKMTDTVIELSDGAIEKNQKAEQPKKEKKVKGPSAYDQVLTILCKKNYKTKEDLQKAVDAEKINVAPLTVNTIYFTFNKITTNLLKAGWSKPGK